MLMNTTFLEDSFLIKWQSRVIAHIIDIFWQNVHYLLITTQLLLCAISIDAMVHILVET